MGNRLQRDGQPQLQRAQSATSEASTLLLISAGLAGIGPAARSSQGDFVGTNGSWGAHASALFEPIRSRKVDARYWSEGTRHARRINRESFNREGGFHVREEFRLRQCRSR